MKNDCLVPNPLPRRLAGRAPRAGPVRLLVRGSGRYPGSRALSAPRRGGHGSRTADLPRGARIRRPCHGRADQPSRFRARRANRGTAGGRGRNGRGRAGAGAPGHGTARGRSRGTRSQRRRTACELESRVRVLEASLQRVSAARESNSVRLDQSVLRAPFDARIGSREVDSGVVVAAGQDVFRLVDSARREVRAGIPQDEAGRLRAGDSLPVRIGGTILQGTLITVGAEVDEATRSRSVRVSVEGVHAPGELAYLLLEETVEQRGAWIPDTAVTEGLRGTWVAYAVTPEGDGAFRVEPRAVTIRHARAGELFVTGLEEGGRLIAGGLHRYAPGQSVRVTPARRLAGVREGA
ncbi:MAG: HlyD family efflux transporter periplasmic adaptor subunit [Gammaproteobacteria bacterium]